MGAHAAQNIHRLGQHPPAQAGLIAARPAIRVRECARSGFRLKLYPLCARREMATRLDLSERASQMASCSSIW
jgi:hypothetical protein